MTRHPVARIEFQPHISKTGAESVRVDFIGQDWVIIASIWLLVHSGGFSEKKALESLKKLLADKSAIKSINLADDICDIANHLNKMELNPITSITVAPNFGRNEVVSFSMAKHDDNSLAKI